MAEPSVNHSSQPPPDHAVSRVGNKVLARDQAARHELQPRLSALLEHLSLFVRRANTRTIGVEVDYKLDGFGTLHTTELRGFTIQADARDRPSAITVRYECIGCVQLQATPKTPDDFFALKDYLARNLLDFTCGIAGNIGKITLRPVVPVEASFKADPQNMAIRTCIRNLHAIGSTNYSLAPDDVDLNLIAEIEKLLLHEPNDFHELTGNTVSREVLDKYREQIARNRAD